MENHGKELCSHEGVREEGMGRCGQLTSKGQNRWCELQHFVFGLKHGLMETICLIHS